MGTARLIFAGAISLAAFGANPTAPAPPAPKSTPAAKPSEATTTIAKQAAPTAGTGATKTEKPDVGGDYVPCFFSESELERIKNPDKAPTLTSANEDQMKVRLLVAAGVLSQADQATFNRGLNNLTLAGLTPSQAFAAVQGLLIRPGLAANADDTEMQERATRLTQLFDEARKILRQYSPVKLTSANETEAKAKLVRAAASLIPEDRETFLEGLSNLTLSGMTPDQAFIAVQALVNREGVAADSATKDEAQRSVLIAPILDEARSVFGDYSNPLSSANENTAKLRLLSAALGLSQTDQDTFRDGLEGLKLTGLAPNQAFAAVQKLLSDNKIAAHEATGLEDARAKLLGPILDNARQTLALFSRPSDVACSASVLDYNETTRAYGHIIASEYIAVQVNIRNLNENQPFVLHNIQFGIASGLERTKYKYVSGRDRVIVRALSASQQFNDPRNIIVHAAYGLGATLSAIAPFAGPTFTAAIAVYNGSTVTSFDKYFRDQSGDQLNLLNDTGYTAASNAEIVVPKSGTAVRVIFVPSKQFREAWWTQACVENVAVGIATDKDTFVPIGSKRAKSIPYLSATDEEVYRAAEACSYAAQNSQDLLKAKNPDEGSAEFIGAQSVKFSKWSGNALAIFRDLSETLVAGTHIVEESDLEPTLTQIICPTDDQGNVSLPAAGDKAGKTDVSCTLIGKNLYKFAKLRLRNDKDPTDAKTVDAPVTVTGGAGGGSAKFQVSDLNGLTAQAYDVFGLTEDGVEQKTTQVIHLKKSSPPAQPSATISKVDPTTISSTGVQPLTVTGTGLKSADKLVLTDAKSHATEFKPVSDPAPTDTEVKFSVDPKTFTPAYTVDTKLNVSVKQGDKELAKTDQVVTFKAPVTAAPSAAAHPAAPKKPVVKKPKS